MNKKAKQILQQADVDKLPSLPHVLLMLLNICHDKSVSYSELAEIIQQDASLTARVLSVSHRTESDTGINAAINHEQLNQYSAHKNAIEQPLESTLQKIGINTIKSIAVTATVQQFFSHTSNDRTEFLKQHWQHSIYCASVAEAIAKICNYSNPAEAYMTGLLHDIGQFLLAAIYPEKYTSAFALLTEDEYFRDLEFDELQCTHQQVGAEFLKKHGANNFVYDAILYHHEPIEHIADTHPLVKIINLSNLLTNNHFNIEDDAIFNAADEILAIKKPMLLEIIEKAEEKLKMTSNILEIKIAVDGMNGKTAQRVHADDDEKQERLAEEVRNIALLDGLHQHLSRTQENKDTSHALAQIITQQSRILFGINSCILFLYDKKMDKVNAIAAQNQPIQLEEISIPLKPGRSLVTEALLDKKACHSLYSYNTNDDDDGGGDSVSNISIIDRQLIGLTEKQGIVCLPMLMDDAIIGTLVIGVDKTQHKTIWKKLSLLTRFANEIAHTISTNNASHLSNDDEQILLIEQKIREVLHEVRNPLSIMNNYLGILSYKLESDKPAQNDVETIKTEIERVNQILNQLTETKESAEESSPTDINSIIADLTKVFQPSLFASKNIHISLDLDQRIKTLQSNANTFKQIYTNLIKNAVEALPANGKLMVYTHDYVNVDGKQHIEISIADNGPGIDDDILPQLFTPVESTKGGNHAGLGLTIVKNLVNELHGSISCRSNDKGTSFHILLPK
jgi:putative nucleotidyltransferase with HDIG domain